MEEVLQEVISRRKLKIGQLRLNLFDFTRIRQRSSKTDLFAILENNSRMKRVPNKWPVASTMNFADRKYLLGGVLEQDSLSNQH